MATMSDDGEKTCPLCAEDMDLTDQQLKPCKCGYEICVWCWHHIMEMAEKEGTEGRCPACRTPYDKERIVGMAANCERVVAGLSSEKKQKSQRAKPKASAEARKHLTGVRVIKRNLVYIIGLPNYLGDESILERKEYFGQYGKVLKVSISRPGATPGTGQQASNNNTFAVYITFAREEEAIRCIHAVNNFILEGNPLRACFGTTKYCHVWLRNMTCTNPNCLYLHDVDSQEDSFTKDEILSAYTRSNVPERVSNNVQQRVGHVLPPPVDDSCNNSLVSGKQYPKIAPNTNVQVKVSTGNTSCGKSPVLPAAASWGSRVSNCRPPASVASSQDPAKQKIETSIAASTNNSSSWHDDAVVSSRMSGGNTSYLNNKSRPVESIKLGNNRQSAASNVSSGTLEDIVCVPKISSWDDDNLTFKIPDGIYGKVSSCTVNTIKPCTRDKKPSVDLALDNIMNNACRSAWDDDDVTLSIGSEGGKSVHKDDNARTSNVTKSSVERDSRTSVSDKSLRIFVDESLAADSSTSSLISSLGPVTGIRDEGVGDDKTTGIHMDPEVSEKRSSGFMLGLPNGVKMDKLSSSFVSGSVDDSTTLDVLKTDQHLNSVSTGMNGGLGSSLQSYYPEHGIKNVSSTLSGGVSCLGSNVLSGLSDRNSDLNVHVRNSDLDVHVLASSGNVMEDSLLASDNKNQRFSHTSNHSSFLANEHSPDMVDRSGTDFWNNKVGGTSLLKNGNATTLDAVFGSRPYSSRQNGSAMSYAQNGELSSLGFRKAAKYSGMLGDVSDVGKIPSGDIGEDNIITNILSLDLDPWDESLPSGNGISKLLGEMNGQDGSSKPSSSWKLQNSNQSRFSFARQENQSDNFDNSVRMTADTHKLYSSSEYTNVSQHASEINSYIGSINIPGSNSAVLSDTTVASRSKISAPPGFPALNRAPPPGFSSHGRYGLSHETPENPLHGHPSLRNQYQDHSVSANDVELQDPAILAVGKGILQPVNSSGFGSPYGLPSQYRPSNYELNLHMKPQHSMTSPQDLRFSEFIGDRFLSSADAYVSSRNFAQNHGQSLFTHMPQLPQHSGISPHIMGSQWENWNGNNDMRIDEILRNERFGFSNGFSHYNDEHKFRGPTSNEYSRAYGR